MKEHLSEILEKIFENISYSKYSETIKERIYYYFVREYELLIENGKNELQSIGEIMSRSGDFRSAAEFAGIEDEDIENVLQMKNGTNTKRYRLLFVKFRIFAVVSALMLGSAVTCIIQGVLFLMPLYFLTSLIGIILGTAILLPCLKQVKALNYNNIYLLPDCKKCFNKYRDRYIKRAANSVILFFIFTAFSIFPIFFSGIFSNMNRDEILSLFVSNWVLPSVILFICIKNILNVLYISNSESEKSRKSVRNYLCRVAAVCAGYLVFSFIFIFILKLFFDNAIVVLYFLTGAFGIAFVFINYKKRSRFVQNNFYINKLRISMAALIVVIFAAVQYMQKDVWVLQPYILSVSEVPHKNHEITYDDGTGIYTIKAEDDEDFKILHLTDIHIGGSVSSSFKDFKALDSCYNLIEYTKPDFVIVTGDLVFPMGIMSFSLNNQAPVIQFASFMKNVGIPWAFTYGNHDTESIATGGKEEINDLYMTLSYKNSKSLLYPYVQPEITGRSNQLIKIVNRDGTLRQALFLIDSNDYTGKKVNDYDYIHDDQVDWYKHEIEKLNAEYGGTVPSMLFFHIPLQEYKTAYNLYEQGSDEVKYYFGEIGETMIDKICCSDYPSKLFDTAVELGSTKAMFCGHDHYNNISLEYKGIRLTYGMSIDYLAMPGIENDTKQRGAEIITISKDSGFNIEQIKFTDIVKTGGIYDILN